MSSIQLLENETHMFLWIVEYIIINLTVLSDGLL
jgi:hypothetical protein